MEIVEEPDPDEYALVMPFIVCESLGGPFDDSSFVAGAYFGEISAIIEADRNFEGYVPTELVPQLDLLAMGSRALFSETICEDDESWTYVTLQPNMIDQEDSPEIS